MADDTNDNGSAFARESRIRSEISELRKGTAALRSEVAAGKGETMALEASLRRYVEDINRTLGVINGKLDEVIGIKSRTDDHTARIHRLEDDHKKDGVEVAKNVGWRERAALVYASIVTAVAGTLGLLRLLGKL